jgi:hypothetical protein
VGEVPDTRWLSTPAINPVALKKIRDLGYGGASPSRLMADAELLRRLTVLQNEFQLISAPSGERSCKARERAVHPIRNL